MAGILWMLCLCLLVQQSFCSLNDATGCLKWRQAGSDVCCEECHQGHRLVRECGPDPKKLCTRCESETFTTQPKAKQCMSCRQCVGALVQVKSCTESSDTVCGCKEGLRCGDKACNFCVTECGKGQEPDGRGCRTCPPGTFNDQIHEKCKPRSTKRPNPDQEIIASGDAVSDIKRANISTPKVHSTESTADMGQAWPLIFPTVFGVVLICIIIILACKAQQRRQTKEIQEETGETPGWKIIEPPSDDPRTLIAIECSFHEAQQEQGSSSESLASKDSSEQLLPSCNRNGKNWQKHSFLISLKGNGISWMKRGQFLLMQKLKRFSCFVGVSSALGDRNGALWYLSSLLSFLDNPEILWYLC